MRVVMSVSPGPPPRISEALPLRPGQPEIGILWPGFASRQAPVGFALPAREREKRGERALPARPTGRPRSPPTGWGGARRPGLAGLGTPHRRQGPGGFQGVSPGRQPSGPRNFITARFAWTELVTILTRATTRPTNRPVSRAARGHGAVGPCPILALPPTPHATRRVTSSWPMSGRGAGQNRAGEVARAAAAEEGRPSRPPTGGQCGRSRPGARGSRASCGGRGRTPRPAGRLRRRQSRRRRRRGRGWAPPPPPRARAASCGADGAKRVLRI